MKKNEMMIIGATKLVKEMYKLQLFDPSKHSFAFTFPGEDCYYRTHGICPIKTGENIPCHCTELLDELMTTSLEQDGPPSLIYDPESDLYTAGDGQHRVCIAIHLHVPIMVFEKIDIGTVVIGEDTLLVTGTSEKCYPFTYT